MGRRWKRLEYSPLNEQRKEFNHHIVIKFHESDSMLSRLFKYSINISLEKKEKKKEKKFFLELIGTFIQQEFGCWTFKNFLWT